jgi:NAD(P)-dependent dehydrogenase (short-subunit alcohol dehydrogenase family)
LSDSRITVITGAARGIGETIARRFAAGGDTIVIGDVIDDAGAATVASLAAGGTRAVYRHLDVTDAESIEAFVAAVEADVGPIDVFINNAGIMQDRSTIESLPMDQHDRVWAVDYRGVYACCRSVLPRMKARRRGVIGNVASLYGRQPYATDAYTPAKCAVIALTEVLAAECGPYNVRINAVSPGYVLTPQMEARFARGVRRREPMERDAALRAMTTMDDVAEAFWFLCSDRARAITGFNLPVDCGVYVATAYNAYPRNEDRT